MNKGLQKQRRMVSDKQTNKKKCNNVKLIKIFTKTKTKTKKKYNENRKLKTRERNTIK